MSVANPLASPKNPSYLCVRPDFVAMKKDLIPILVIVLIFLGGYYLLSIDDPRKIQQVVLALVPAILVYYLIVKRRNGQAVRHTKSTRRNLTEKTARD